MTSRHTFLYFAYGSNLLAERIHINNPSARFKNVAKLDQHQLDFNYFSQVTNLSKSKSYPIILASQAQS